jgi:hypothetical protein
MDNPKGKLPVKELSSKQKGSLNLNRFLFAKIVLISFNHARF